MADFNALDSGQPNPTQPLARDARDSELSAVLESHHAAERAAVDVAQTVVRTGFVVNASAIIAIPAIVALFNLDADAIRWSLLWTGGLFRNREAI